jgi:hypothetical protein
MVAAAGGLGPFILLSFCVGVPFGTLYALPVTWILLPLSFLLLSKLDYVKRWPLLSLGTLGGAADDAGYVPRLCRTASNAYSGFRSFDCLDLTPRCRHRLDFSVRIHAHDAQELALVLGMNDFAA